MPATAPLKKSPYMIEWMTQAAPLREASTVKKMNDRLLLFCLNKKKHTTLKNRQLEMNSMNFILMSKNKRKTPKNT